jgi:hypothetical protein
MGETMVSYHTPGPRKVPAVNKKKRQVGPIKSKVHVRQTKQIVLSFLDRKSHISTHITPREASIIAIYVIKILGNFMKQLRIKRLEMVSLELFFSLGQPSGPYPSIAKD